MSAHSLESTGSNDRKVDMQHLKGPIVHLVACIGGPLLPGKGSGLCAEETDIVHRSTQRMEHAGKVTKLRCKTKRWRTGTRPELALAEAAVEEALCHDGKDGRAAAH